MSQPRKRRRPRGLQAGPFFSSRQAWCDCPSCIEGETIAVTKGLGGKYVLHIRAEENMEAARAVRHPRRS